MDKDMENLIIASYGGGINSTALLIECVKRCIPVNLILFADTGAEKPHTYSYVSMFSSWLVDHGYPEIITVKPTKTIIQDCQDRKTLPSVAFGYRTCSDRFKIAPQRKFLNNWLPAKEAWKSGDKVTKLIGYDADEPYRADRPIPEHDANKYENWYPLIDWDMGRDECIESIESVGLCVPGKSACFLCPNSKPSEIRQNYSNYPDLMKIALTIEENAELGRISGLGRNFNWNQLLSTDEMFADGYSATPEMVCGCYDG